MAYMNQAKKKTIEPKIKEILKKYGIKGRLGVNDHSTLVLNIKSGKIDFLGNYNEIARLGCRTDWVDVKYLSVSQNYNDRFSDDAVEFFEEIFTVMYEENHDNSDIQSDYFDVGWYVSVNIGKWDKPYILEK